MESLVKNKMVINSDLLRVFDHPEFVFDEKQHRYQLCGRELTPVSTFIQRFSAPFDPGIARFCAPGMGMTEEQVLDFWANKRDLAARIGTRVHRFVEDFIRRDIIKWPSNPLAAELVRKWLVLWYECLLVPEIEILGVEPMVFSALFGVAGTIDLLIRVHARVQLLGVVLEPGIYILDWKTNEKFEHDGNFKRRARMLAPFSKLLDHKHHQYSCQLGTYGVILQQAGIPVRGAVIIHLAHLGPIAAYHAFPMMEQLAAHLTQYPANGTYPNTYRDGIL